MSWGKKELAFLNNLNNRNRNYPSCNVLRFLKIAISLYYYLLIPVLSLLKQSSCYSYFHTLLVQIEECLTQFLFCFSTIVLLFCVGFTFYLSYSFLLAYFTYILVWNPEVDKPNERILMLNFMFIFRIFRIFGPPSPLM